MSRCNFPTSIPLPSLPTPKLPSLAIPFISIPAYAPVCLLDLF
jgi:hypothetical protein